MLAFLHLLVFLTAVAALLWSGARVSAVLTDDPAVRVIATAVLFATAATVEALALGLVRLGTDPWALWLASVATAAAAHWCLRGRHPKRIHPGQIWAGLDPVTRAVLGAAAAGLLLWTAWLLDHPSLAVDAARYHLGEPVLWLRDGRPGSWHATLSTLPDQADPKNLEVLFAWCLGLARTPVVVVPLMISLLALVPWATATGLRNMGVSRRVATLLAITLAGVPYVGVEAAIETNDMVALAWMICAGALAAAARRRAALMAPALLAAGLAIGTKPTCIPLVGIVVLIMLVGLRRQLKGVLRPLVACGLVGGFLALVWPIQTAVHYGAPFYPWSQFPAGSPLPPAMRFLSARFMSHPLTAIRVGTPKGYAEALGGGLVLLLGLPVAAVIATVIKDRWTRSAAWVAVLAAVVAALIWSASPETGWSGVTGLQHMVVGTGARFLLPTLTAVILAWGLASKAPGLSGWVVYVAVVAALAADIAAWSAPSFGFPYRPPVPWIFGAVALGSLLGASVGRHRLEALQQFGPRPRWRLVAAAGAAIIFSGILTVPVDGYVSREIPIGLNLGLPAEQGLAYLATQSAWVHGQAPVLVGPAFNALLAGPTFGHEVTYVSAQAPCSGLQNAQRTDWIILTDSEPSDHLSPAFHKIRCLAGIQPAFRAGSTAVFAPLGSEG